MQTKGKCVLLQSFLGWYENLFRIKRFIKELVNQIKMKNSTVKSIKTVNYLREDFYNASITEDLIKNYVDILDRIGEDPAREGLLKTPERASKAMQFLTSGYDMDPKEILTSAMFKEEYSEMVLVKEIRLGCLEHRGGDKKRTWPESLFIIKKHKDEHGQST